MRSSEKPGLTCPNICWRGGRSCDRNTGCTGVVSRGWLMQNLLGVVVMIKITRLKARETHRNLVLLMTDCTALTMRNNYRGEEGKHQRRSRINNSLCQLGGSAAAQHPGLQPSSPPCPLPLQLPGVVTQLSRSPEWKEIIVLHVRYTC